MSELDKWIHYYEKANNMKNKVVITIETDGIITVESVKSALKKRVLFSGLKDTYTDAFPPNKPKFKENDRIVVTNKDLESFGKHGYVKEVGAMSVSVLLDDMPNSILVTHSDIELVKEKTIPFNIDLWRKGDFKKVVTRDGREVSKLHDFETQGWRLVGVINESVLGICIWGKDGHFENRPEVNSRDLMLLIETTEQ